MDINQYGAIYQELVKYESYEKLRRKIDIAEAVKMGSHAMAEQKANAHFLSWYSMIKREIEKLYEKERQTIWEGVNKSGRI